LYGKYKGLYMKIYCTLKYCMVSIRADTLKIMHIEILNGKYKGWYIEIYYTLKYCMVSIRAYI
jgi:hypothetical protein